MFPALIDLCLRLCLSQLVENGFDGGQFGGGYIIANISDFECVDVLCVAIGRAPFVELVFAIQFIVVIER
jgi:hypothetical protein